MADTSPRAVVVGAGGISSAWFPPLAAEKVDVAAVVDLNVEVARSKIATYGLACEASADLAAVLERTRPDFVVDLTVPASHCEVTCTALRAGCHVIGEKPMAASMEEARRMVAASEETGRLYMVSQSRRWDPKHDRVRMAVASGGLGTVTTVTCDFFIGAHFGGFRDAMPSPLVLDMAIHHFDLARFMTGLDATAVYAHEFNPRGSWYAGDAAASCIFEMSGGALFTYEGSWCAEGLPTSWNGDWRIVGEKGSLAYEHDGDPVAQVVAGGEGFRRPLGDLPVPPSSMTAIGMHGALAEMLAFLRTGRKPQTECHDNIRSLAMVFGVLESSKKRTRVTLPSFTGT
jgi:predicted dehydrogenase